MIIIIILIIIIIYNDNNNNNNNNNNSLKLWWHNSGYWLKEIFISPEECLKLVLQKLSSITQNPPEHSIELSRTL